jgi:hypothetical protein
MLEHRVGVCMCASWTMARSYVQISTHTYSVPRFVTTVLGMYNTSILHPLLDLRIVRYLMMNGRPEPRLGGPGAASLDIHNAGGFVRTRGWQLSGSNVDQFAHGSSTQRQDLRLSIAMFALLVVVVGEGGGLLY